jgi:sugar lactone lactonase YvrE
MFLNVCCRLALVVGSLAVSATVFAQGAEKVADRFETGNNTYVRSLLHDKAGGSLWVGTSVGVMEIDLKTVTPRRTFTRNDGLANEYVFAMGIDSQGYNWFGTNAGGASRYKNGKWKTYFPMHGLADYWIYSFANDKNGNLWIGTWAGANRFDVKTGKFTTYVKELINEWVYGLGVDKEGRVWFGTEGGISMFDGKRWKSQHRPRNPFEA